MTTAGLGHGLINELERVGENLVAEKAQDRRQPFWFSRSWNALRGQIRPILRTFDWQIEQKAFVLRQISLSLACSSPAKSDKRMVQMKRLPLYLPIKRHF